MPKSNTDAKHATIERIVIESDENTPMEVLAWLFDNVLEEGVMEDYEALAWKGQMKGDKQ